MNPSANVFVFGNFNLHHKDWLTYSGRLVDLVNSIIIFLSRMASFPTQISDYDSHSPALLDLFISSDASICSAMAFPWEILILLLSQFLLTFHQIHNGMPHCITPLLK